jgi:hypothetical protein
MKKSIGNPSFRALRATFVAAMTVTVAVSCFVPTIPGVIEEPKPCTCDCECNTGKTYCKSDTIPAGSVECSNTCVAIGTSEVKCKDKTRDDIELPPFDPPDPVECTASTPHLFTTYVFCKICTETPASESDLFIGACTEDEAREEAERIAVQDGGESQDCSISDDTCSSQEE